MTALKKKRDLTRALPTSRKVYIQAHARHPVPMRKLADIPVGGRFWQKKANKTRFMYMIPRACTPAPMSKLTLLGLPKLRQADRSARRHRASANSQANTAMSVPMTSPPPPCFGHIDKPGRALNGATSPKCAAPNKASSTPEMEYIAIRETQNSMTTSDMRQHWNMSFGANTPNSSPQNLCVPTGTIIPKQHQPPRIRTDDFGRNFGQNQCQYR